MVRSCVGGLFGGGGKGMTRRRRVSPSTVPVSHASEERSEAGTHVVYITTPSRANVPALKAANRAVRALINRRRTVPVSNWPSVRLS
jgi:hypothetical protein